MLGIITIIFILECVIKVIAHGFYFGHKTYLKDGWNVLDFIIVMFSILTIILTQFDTDIGFIRVFRTLRALRPLRAASKNEGKYFGVNIIFCFVGIKTVVNSLLISIPSLLHVMMIVLLFILVFGILGIQLFKG